MKVAIIAPLVSAIREPQGGGSQAFVSDLARGLAGRGHEVHVYAATGSEIPGVTVIDTGVDPGSLAGHAVPGRRRGRAATRRAAASGLCPRLRRGPGGPVRRRPQSRLRRARRSASRPDSSAPVVHTLHLPPDAAIAAALATRPRAAVSRRPWPACPRSRRAPGARSPGSTRSCRRTCRRVSIPWSPAAGDGAVFAGRLSPEKGAAEAIDIAQAAGRRDRRLRRRLRRGVRPRADRPAAGRARRRRCIGAVPADIALGGDGPRGGGSLPGEVGRAVRHGRRRGAGVRHSGRRVPPRRARRDDRGRRDRLPGRARRHPGGRGRVRQDDRDLARGVPRPCRTPSRPGTESGRSRTALPASRQRRRAGSRGPMGDPAALAGGTGRGGHGRQPGDRSRHRRGPGRRPARTSSSRPATATLSPASPARIQARRRRRPRPCRPTSSKADRRRAPVCRRRAGRPARRPGLRGRRADVRAVRGDHAGDLGGDARGQPDRLVPVLPRGIHRHARRRARDGSSTSPRSRASTPPRSSPGWPPTTSPSTGSSA